MGTAHVATIAGQHSDVILWDKWHTSVTALRSGETGNLSNTQVHCLGDMGVVSRRKVYRAFSLKDEDPSCLLDWILTDRDYIVGSPLT